MSEASAAYPVTYDVEPQLTDRNRLTCFFRIILAIPHLILVGGPGLGGLGALGYFSGDNNWFVGGSTSGVLGLVAGVMAIIAWFAILFANSHPQGLRDFAGLYLRWRSKAIAYVALLRDEYPPFGEGDYGVSLTLPAAAPVSRDKLSVALRLIYAIPHFIVLFFVGFAWAITAIIAWFAILFTGSYPESLYNFGVGYLRWSLRVESYMLLLHRRVPALQPGVGRRHRGGGRDSTNDERFPNLYASTE